MYDKNDFNLFYKVCQSRNLIFKMNFKIAKILQHKSDS